MFGRMIFEMSGMAFIKMSFVAHMRFIKIPFVAHMRFIIISCRWFPASSQQRGGSFLLHGLPPNPDAGYILKVLKHKGAF